MSMLNFLAFASLKKSIRITNRSQKIIPIELHLNSRELQFSQNESSVKVTISKCIPNSQVCRFTLITYFDYIAVIIFYQEEPWYFRKYNKYMPSFSQCSPPPSHTVLMVLCSCTACLYNITTTPVLLNYVIISSILIWENFLTGLNFFQNQILLSICPVLI